MESTTIVGLVNDEQDPGREQRRLNDHGEHHGSDRMTRREAPAQSFG